MDGTEVRRLAHHRSRRLDHYWHQPRAAISRDGKLAVFDSNFGANPIDEYSDVYLLDVAAAVTAAAPSDAGERGSSGRPR
jgi:hypothetical protein